MNLTESLLQHATAADLCELLAAVLTELKQRENAGESGLDLEETCVLTQFADISWKRDHGRFAPTYYDEGSASLAAEQTRQTLTGGAA